MYPTLKQELRMLMGWTKLKDGIEIAEFEYQSKEWKKPRRMVVVRKNIEILKKATGKLLLWMTRWKISLQFICQLVIFCTASCLCLLV